MRYDSIQILTRTDGKQAYATVIYPAVPPRDDDYIYTTTERDYLDNLANRFYKDPTKYWIIACANNLGKGRIAVESGIKIRIPTHVSAVMSAYNRANGIS